MWYRNFSGNTKWSDGQVVERLGRNNYSVRVGDGSAAQHRHIDQLKRRSSCVFPTDTAISTGGETGYVSRASVEPQRASPVTKPLVSVEAKAQEIHARPDQLSSVGEDFSEVLTPKTPPGTEANLPNSDKPPQKRLRKPVVRFGLEID